MNEHPNERRALLETAIAWREARDKCKPGSPDYIEFDQNYREAQQAVANFGKPPR